MEHTTKESYFKRQLTTILWITINFIKENKAENWPISIQLAAAEL
jgi:hypothetical protein